jgi:hypothetical protein
MHNDSPSNWADLPAQADERAAREMAEAAGNSPAKETTAKTSMPAAVAKHVKGASAGSELDAELDAEARAKAEQLRRLGASPDEISRQVGQLAPPKPSQLTLEKELAAIRELKATDKAKYWGDAVQERERELIEALSAAKNEKMKPAGSEEAGDPTDPDEILSGLDPSLVEQWRREGGAKANLERAQATADVAIDSLEETDAPALLASFEELPAEIQVEAFRFMALPAGAGEALLRGHVTYACRISKGPHSSGCSQHGPPHMA